MLILDPFVIYLTFFLFFIFYFYLSDKTLELFQSPLGTRLKADLFTIDEDIPDFKTLTFRERVFKSLYQYLDPLVADERATIDESIWNIYETLQDVLYPWIKPHWRHVFDINKSQHGRGIIMCVGNDYFHHAVTSITAIRNVLDSDLPIEIFYIDEYDLSQDKRDYFNNLANVSTRSLVDYINDEYTQFGGWAMKPYAMLASSFTEVILMDADVFLFQKPDLLFEDEGYQKTGSLFFLDRTLFPRWDVGRKWMNSFLPTKSSYVKESRWYLDTSAHEQESGIVVINKRKSLFGLLSSCKMNDKNERDKVAYERIHGDKEVNDIKKQGDLYLQVMTFFIYRLSGLALKWYKPHIHSFVPMVPLLAAWAMPAIRKPFAVTNSIWMPTTSHFGGTAASFVIKTDGMTDT
jgi:hypothetical protein